jgi:hypothetical protein
MTSPIPSAPFEVPDLILGDNDEEIELYLSFLGDYRIHYQDLPLQIIPSLAHPHRKQPSAYDEDSVGSETTTTLSLHTVPFSVTSMDAALHPPFSAVTPQLDTDGPMDRRTDTTKYTRRRTMMEITPSTVAETPILESPRSLAACRIEPDDVPSVSSGHGSNIHRGVNHSRHADCVDTPQRTDPASAMDSSIDGNSEQAVASLNEAADPMGYFGEAAGAANEQRRPQSPCSHTPIQQEQVDSVDQCNNASCTRITATRSVSSTSDPVPEYGIPASIPVPKWIRVPPATEPRRKALRQRVRSAERNALDAQTQLIAAHVLVDALWDIVLDQQQKLSYSLDPDSISITYKDIYYIQAAGVELRCWNRYGRWLLPFASLASIVVVSSYKEHWHILCLVLLLLWFHVPKLQYSHSLD